MLELDFISLFMHINEFSPSMIWWLDNERQLLLKKHDVSERLVGWGWCEALLDFNEIFIEDHLRFLSPLTLNNFSIKSFNPPACGLFKNLLSIAFIWFWTVYTDVSYRFSAWDIKVDCRAVNFRRTLKEFDFHTREYTGAGFQVDRLSFSRKSCEKINKSSMTLALRLQKTVQLLNWTCSF